MHFQQRILATLAMADIRIAELMAEAGDIPLAIESARSVVNNLVEGDERFMRSEAVAVLVQSLLMRGSDADLEEAESEIARLAAMPTDPSSVLAEVQLLRMRALAARARGDAAAYREYADRYLARAKSLGLEGHMAIAETMR